MAAFALRACASEVVLLALGEAVQDWPNSSLAWRALTIRKSKGTEGNNKDKLVQYWAFADLTRLEKARRVEIYSLSDPGKLKAQTCLLNSLRICELQNYELSKI